MPTYTLETCPFYAGGKHVICKYKDAEELCPEDCVCKHKNPPTKPTDPNYDPNDPNIYCPICHQPIGTKGEIDPGFTVEDYSFIICRHEAIDNIKKYKREFFHEVIQTIAQLIVDQSKEGYSLIITDPFPVLKSVDKEKNPYTKLNSEDIAKVIQIFSSKGYEITSKIYDDGVQFFVYVDVNRVFYPNDPYQYHDPYATCDNMKYINYKGRNLGLIDNAINPIANIVKEK